MNQGPSDLQSDALPTELSRHKNRELIFSFIITWLDPNIFYRVPRLNIRIVDKGNVYNLPYCSFYRYYIYARLTAKLFITVLLRYLYQFEHKTGVGGLAQVVERSIRIREAPGSIPGFSIFVNLDIRNGRS